MASPFQHLTVDRDGSIERLTLNRPAVRNALNDDVLGELRTWAEGLPAREDVRAVVLQGAGTAFCAGADVAWMARTLEFSAEENLASARSMAHTFRMLNALPVPLIGRVHGPAIGGGAGLVAVCDIVIAAEEAVFAFTEVQLGILPAVIAPYVRAKIGESASRHLFLSGARFSAADAHRMGLVHHVVKADALDGAVAAVSRDVMRASPTAIARAKSLLAALADGSRPLTSDGVVELTSHAIAEQRVSADGQEGLRAFLEKRRPRWAE